MGWQRTCDLCKSAVETEQKRVMKISKASILGFKDGRFHLDSKYPRNEICICEQCAKIKSIKELWQIIDYNKVL